MLDGTVVHLKHDARSIRGRDCRLYSPETDAALLWSVGARHPRGQGVALHWSRRHGLQSCDLKRTSRQAEALAKWTRACRKVSIQPKSQRT